MSTCPLSIVIPIYNAEKFLSPCLESVVRQTLEGIEIICVNDGSSDGTQRIIDDFRSRYPNKVKSFEKENTNGVDARDFGVRQATGEYVGFCDHDDYVEPDWALKLYRVAKDSDADIAVCAYDRVEFGTGKVMNVEMCNFGGKTMLVTPEEYRLLTVNTAVWNKIFRLSKVRDIDAECYFGDLCFWVCSLLDAKKIVFISDVLYHYQVSGTSGIATMRKQDVANIQHTMGKIKSAYERHPNGARMVALRDMFAFIHLGVSLPFRLSSLPTKDFREVREEILRQLNRDFSTWRKSPAIRMKNVTRNGLGGIRIWLCWASYRLHAFGAFIWLYVFITQKLGVEIKW